MSITKSNQQNNEFKFKRNVVLVKIYLLHKSETERAFSEPNLKTVCMLKNLHDKFHFFPANALFPTDIGTVNKNCFGSGLGRFRDY